MIHASEQLRPDVQVARVRWVEEAKVFDPDLTLYLDETWIATNMTRRYGWAPRNRRCIDRVPFGHWQTTTYLAGLRTTGLVAPLVLDGPINGEIFLAWVQQQLVPELRQGELVVMDNLSSHKVAGVRSAIESSGARLLYLPPYSPDLNPIEMVFSKVKALLRMLREREMSGLWSKMGSIDDYFPESEWCRYFRHCGVGA